MEPGLPAICSAARPTGAQVVCRRASPELLSAAYLEELVAGALKRDAPSELAQLPLEAHLAKLKVAELKEELSNLEFEYMMDLAPSKPPKAAFTAYFNTGIFASSQIAGAQNGSLSNPYRSSIAPN